MIEDRTIGASQERAWRVLVVEDYVANRQAAQALLESLGCEVRTAARGREALEILAQDIPDIVLMDCVMPDMDGYETTRRIRHTLKSPVPIIAMTANAMPHDRHLCFEAGMNDFIVKPLARASLREILRRWTIHGPAARPSVAARRSAGTAPAILDEETFQELKDILRERPEVIRHIYFSFFDNTAAIITDLAGGSGEVCRALHTLEGSAAMMGASRIAEIAAQRCKTGARTPAQAKAQVAERLAQELEIFRRAVMDRLGDPAS